MFDGANNFAPHVFNASLAGMQDLPDGSWCGVCLWLIERTECGLIMRTDHNHAHRLTD